MEDKFLTYVRTLQFWQLRLKGKETDFVYIPSDEVKYFNADVQKLIENKELEIKEHTTQKGHKAHLYKVLNKGAINLTLIKPKGNELNSTHKQMMSYLMNVSLPTEAPRTIYFDVFLKYREYEPQLFFTVDNFSKRVHTPVTSFSKEYRPNLLLFGEKTTSFDVVTMQPLLLGKILKNEIGSNEFSEWINKGDDIYIKLQNKANLSTRDEAKKKFFEILFGKSNKQLEVLFSASNWINWINEFKNKPFTPNPHTLEKNHSNLAYLLQSTEVELMSKVWIKLIEFNIPFVSVHDEIIIQERNKDKAHRIFNNVLCKEFEYFKLNTDESLIKQPIEVIPEAFKPHQISLIETDTPKPIEWNINELETFFISIPDQSIRISNFEFITSTKTFTQSHIDYLKHNNGNKTFEPYYNRLLTLKQFLCETMN